MTVESGYAAGFNVMMQYVEALLPSREIITSTVRETKREYPPAAVREAIANALIHQDLSVRGSCVLVEIFANRIEVTNPGRPLVDVMRIIDNPPRTRNGKLASLMRRLNLCEELGTGWDRITLACEKMHMPAPRVDLYDENMKVSIFDARPFAELTSQDRLWSCYMHTCLKYINGEQATNSSMRERFDIPTSTSGSISRLIKTAIAKGMIRPLDKESAPKYMCYVPSWA